MHVSHMLWCNIFVKSIYSTSLTTLPTFLPHCHLFCGYHPPSTFLSTCGGLPGKWFLLFLPNLEFQLQIYPSESAKGRQSQCQTHCSFPVGHIFNSVTGAEKGSWLPSERGRAQHCKRSQQLCPVQEGQIIKGFKTVKSVVSEKNSIIDIHDILKTLHICLHRNKCTWLQSEGLFENSSNKTC